MIVELVKEQSEERETIDQENKAKTNNSGRRTLKDKKKVNNSKCHAHCEIVIECYREQKRIYDKM